MKLNDKVWLFFNRKRPTSKNASYFYVTAGWMFCGIMWLMALAGTSASIETGEPEAIVVAILMFVTASVFSTFLYLGDRRMGYVDAIHKHHTESWEKRQHHIQEQKQGTEIKQEVQ